MTADEKKEFKELVKGGSLEALKSNDGQKAIVNAMNSRSAKDVFLDVFVDAFHDVVIPVIENLHADHEKRIQELEAKRKIH